MDSQDYYFLISKWKREGLNQKEISSRYLELNNYQRYIGKSKREQDKYFKQDQDYMDKNFKKKFKELLN